MTSAWQLLSDLLAALPDPSAELALRRQLAREAFQYAQADGWREGYEHGARLLEAEWPSVIAPLLNDLGHDELERRRFHVCCRDCRLAGHRDGCERCQNRSRETYGHPHPDDFPRRKVTAA